MPKRRVFLTKWVHVQFTEHGDILVTINKYWYSRGQQIRRSHIATVYPYRKASKLETLIRILGNCKDDTQFVIRPNGWSVQVNKKASSKSLSYSPKVIPVLNSDEIGGTVGND